jgi:hypothetical protein
MTRGILIAGAESSLSAAIAAEAGKRVERLAAAFIPERNSASERFSLSTGNDSIIPLGWNPGSPISARSLVLAAVNRLEHIDEAILVCTPPTVRKEAYELTPGDIDTIINDHIKGWFFLVKELTVYFKARASGTLALALSETGGPGARNDAVDMTGPPVAAAFRSLAQGLLSASFGKPYMTAAFSSETGEDADFATFIFKHLEEGSRRGAGKWHKFGMLSFFGR